MKTRKIPNKLSLLLFATVTGVVLLFSACSKDEEITMQPAQVLGEILIRPGTQIDIDINDSAATAPTSNNNSAANAQALPNPVEVGGYVAVSGAGVPGALSGGDSDDFYTVYMRAGQDATLVFNSGTLLLNVTDPNNTQTTPGNGIYTASIDGAYILNVQATAGAGSYTLTVGNLANATVAATATGSVTNYSVDQEFVPGEIIVRFNSPTISTFSAAQEKSLYSRINNMGFKIAGGAANRDMLLSMSDVSNRKAVRSSLNLPAAASLKQETLDAIKALSQRADVAEARPNFIRHAFALPNDPGLPYLWHYDLINLQAAWDISKGDQVTVAVLDTGILAQHPDFAGKLVAGYDFISDPVNAADGDGIDIDPNDEGDNPPNSSFHGSHVAGTIGAATDNGVGIPGVGWNVKIMPLRVLGTKGGSDYDIEQAILYAIGENNDSGQKANPPVDVINMSLGGPAIIGAVPNAYKLARQKNVFIVAAAGNDSAATPVPFSVYPAGIPGVVSVGAVGSAKTVASYSNYGSFLSLVAPGGDATGADRNNDGYFDGVISLNATENSPGLTYDYEIEIGTSMASPHAAGVIALMKSVYPALTIPEFESWLSNGQLTEDLAPSGRDDKSGYGLIDAEKAVRLANETANGGAANAQISVNPITLNFGSNLDTLTLTVENIGAGALTTPVTLSPQQAWISFNPVSVDNDGLGSYNVSIDRSQLANIEYSSSILVQSSEPTVTVPVNVSPLPIPANAGIQHVELVDVYNSNIRYTTIAVYNNGAYHFSFDNVAPSRYYVNSYSNLDNDATTDCSAIEACGSYLATDGSPNFVVVLEGKQASVSFYTGFNSATGGTPLSIPGSQVIDGF